MNVKFDEVNMITLKKIATVWGCTESYSGRFRDCKVTISSVHPKYAVECNTWYYVISKMGFAYNSNLYRIMFESKEKCKIAAENKVEELILANFSDKENNVYCK